MNRKEIGRKNEKLAQNFLKDNGYEIIQTNFQCKFGEIDIICKENNNLVFVEVRSKSYDYFGTPEETVEYQKQQKIIKTANYFIEKSKIDYEEVRFDVISILDGKIKHIKNAFEV
jgi:putative endonuclease